MVLNTWVEVGGGIRSRKWGIQIRNQRKFAAQSRAGRAHPITPLYGCDDFRFWPEEGPIGNKMKMPPVLQRA